MVIPQGEKLHVRMYKSERVSSGGIVIPEQIAGREDQAQTKAVVVSVGLLAFEQERKHELMFNRTGRIPVEGDVIMMARHAGIPFEQNGEKYRIIADADVTAIIEEHENE